MDPLYTNIIKCKPYTSELAKYLTRKFIYDTVSAELVTLKKEKFNP